MKKRTTIIWYGLAILSLLERGVNGHGRLIEPPSRASAWRFGFDTPHNYNDHELYCGGFTRQWNKNNGKCGVCGDAWDSPTPRSHELGGRFGQGVIVRRYAPNAVIVIKVELVAYHKGYFQFRICNKPSVSDQDCMDKHVLHLESREDTKFYPKDGNKVYEMKYQLPEGLKCSHCVLQWKYIAGNNWGTCDNGTEMFGCGPQEEFRACADIAIGDHFAPTTNRPRPKFVDPRWKLPTPAPVESTRIPWFWWVVIATITLFVAVAVLAGLTLYYYRGGVGRNEIKGFFLFLKYTIRPTPPSPVLPPINKRTSLSMETPPESSAPK